jgi:hypothetical protein
MDTAVAVIPQNQIVLNYMVIIMSWFDYQAFYLCSAYPDPG